MEKMSRVIARVERGVLYGPDGMPIELATGQRAVPKPKSKEIKVKGDDVADLEMCQLPEIRGGERVRGRFWAETRNGVRQGSVWTQEYADSERAEAGDELTFKGARAIGGRN
jgi:hypothetical protein